MRAVTFTEFSSTPTIEDVPDPLLPAGGAVVRVAATGVCRSDWHAWSGHDDSVSLPHIPGHEFAGVIEEIDPTVPGFKKGDRVTAPFIFACGDCAHCRAGHTQVCPNQQQPGFDLKGSWAEYVAVTNAATNLVHLPDELDFDIAAGLGCRFGTAYHAVTVQGRVQPGETVAVIGCGGVGLSCVMIARAAGARVIAVDRTQSALDAAEKLGATPLYSDETTVARIHELGGAHVSIDALGARITATMAIESLRPKGRHVQVGLLLGEDANPPLPYGRAIALELELLGSHGLATSEYAAMLADVASGHLDLAGTVGTRIGFDDLPAALPAMNEPPRAGSFGMTVAVLEHQTR